jgi:hypothetical protein
MRRRSILPSIVLPAALAALSLATPLHAQQRETLPLSPVRGTGLGVSPVYEGWYQNKDGTYTLSFGYMNRNSTEVIEIPVGAANSISVGGPDRGQPAVFLPRRNYGVFTVNVPADFGDKTVVWTLDLRGEKYQIPGRIQKGYEIDALGAPTTGNEPPVLSFDSIKSGMGPAGVQGAPMRAVVGQPLTIATWTTEADKRAQTLRWSKYRGPGTVTFAPATVQVAAAALGTRATTTATFSAPGEYMLFVRAGNGAVAGAGHEQCCWTNGYVKVTVTAR